MCIHYKKIRKYNFISFNKYLSIDDALTLALSETLGVQQSAR